MKMKMLIFSCLVLGFGLVLYGCSKKPSSENSYPLYTVKYLYSHPKFAQKLYAKCNKVESGFGFSHRGYEVFNKTTLGKDCHNYAVASQIPHPAPVPQG